MKDFGDKDQFTASHIILKNEFSFKYVDNKEVLYKDGATMLQVLMLTEDCKLVLLQKYK